MRECRPHEQSYGVEFLRSKNVTEFKLCELPIIQDSGFCGRVSAERHETRVSEGKSLRLQSTANGLPEDSKIQEADFGKCAV